MKWVRGAGKLNALYYNHSESLFSAIPDGHPDILKYLLKAGLNPRHKAFHFPGYTTILGENYLERTISRDDVESLKVLLSAGIDPNYDRLFRSESATVSQMAQAYKAPQILAHLGIQTKSPPAQVVANRSRSEAASSTFEYFRTSDPYGLAVSNWRVGPPIPYASGAAMAKPQTALHLAAAGGDSAQVSALLAKGENLEAVDEDGYTPLILALRARHFELAKELIRAGANVNAVSDFGSAALAFATLSNDESLIHLFFTHGAYPDLCNESSLSPLDAAIEYELPKMAKLLLEYGAHPDMCSGNTDHEIRPNPLMRAILKKNLELVTLLLDHGANPNACALFMALDSQDQLFINEWPVARYALYSNDRAIMDRLWVAGSDFAFRNLNVGTARDMAVKENLDQAAAFLRDHNLW